MVSRDSSSAWLRCHLETEVARFGSWPHREPEARDEWSRFALHGVPSDAARRPSARGPTSCRSSQYLARQPLRAGDGLVLRVVVAMPSVSMIVLPTRIADGPGLTPRRPRGSPQIPVADEATARRGRPARRECRQGQRQRSPAARGDTAAADPRTRLRAALPPPRANAARRRPGRVSRVGRAVAAGWFPLAYRVPRMPQPHRETASQAGAVG